MITDVHCHYLPAAVGQTRVLDPLPDGICRFARRALLLPSELADLSLQSQAMDRQRVDRRLLSPPPFALGYDLPPAEALQWCRLLNFGMAEAVSRDPSRFRGLATVPLHAPAAAVDELRFAMEELGLSGVIIGTHAPGVELDDPRLEAFWEAAAHFAAPVLVHPEQVAGAERMHEYHLRNLVGNPLETALAGARLIFSGVITRHPGLRVILAHGGGALPFLAGRLQRGYLVRSECRTAPEEPLDGLRRFYYDSILFHGPSLSHLVSQVGADRVMLGSDAPFDMGEDQPVAAVAAAGLHPDQSATIFQNGATLLTPPPGA